MSETKFELAINRGKSYEHLFLGKKDFLAETSKLFKEPKKIFLGMGNFLELGDYHNLLDSVLFFEEGIELEKILDKNNRRVAAEGNIPFSFFKLAVYFPDFLLKDVPASCLSIIGKKSRLAPGAEIFFQHIKKYSPLVLTAIPYSIAIEFIKRLGLGKENLFATDYKVKKDNSQRVIFTGGINRFVSGDRKSIEIEKCMIDNSLTENEVAYIGSGEAGMATFSRIRNSIAFNPTINVMPESRINVYGSSLESLLVLFNFNEGLRPYLMSGMMDDCLPSLVVYSESREKPKELMELEMEHRRYQKNILSQRVEHSGTGFDTVLNDINVELKGSPIGIENIREMVYERIKKHMENPQEIVKTIYSIARERYKSLGME
ncbi:MAG: hypothetical protein MUD12_14895 [Spirochaetes bacterium]|jgi:hypothetical protein|nr:hypothetical protein [Spirochaetota bacterium]